MTSKQYYILRDAISHKVGELGEPDKFSFLSMAGSNAALRDLLTTMPDIGTQVHEALGNRRQELLEARKSLDKLFDAQLSKE